MHSCAQMYIFIVSIRLNILAMSKSIISPLKISISTMALSKTLVCIFLATLAIYGVFAVELTEELFGKIQNKIIFAFLICNIPVEYFLLE